MYQSLYQKLLSREEKFSIIGLGYIETPTINVDGKQSCF